MHYVWLNSKIMPISEARVPANCLGFLLGASVFEAIRANWNEQKSFYCINNLKLHINRLFDSMKIMRMHTSMSKQDIENTVVDLVEFWNGKQDAYIRITAFVDSPSPGSSVYDPSAVHTNIMISIVESPIVEHSINISCCTSSWQRISDNSMPPRVKSACNYENTRLAGFEAISNGYDNSIILNQHGKISEAAESTLFYFDRLGTLVTPNCTSDILCSINRYLISRIWREHFSGDYIEREVDRTELYTAQEVFICNTAKLIRSVVDIDRITIGNTLHPKTDSLMRKYIDVIRGNDESFLDNSILVSA